MLKHLLKTCVAVLAIAAAATGPARGQSNTLWPSDAVVYDFEAAAAASENPSNKNGSSANGQKFYGWENSSNGYTDKDRQDYKGYEYSTGSVLPQVCHVWRRSDRINGNVSGHGGLYCPSNKEFAIDGLTAGFRVMFIFDSTNVTGDSKQMLWAIGDGTASGGPGHPRATATIGGVEAVTGVTPIRSGDTIIVNSVTPAENGTGYIVVRVLRYMVIKQIAVWYEEPAPEPTTYTLSNVPDGWTVTADGDTVTLQGDTARIYEGSAVVLIPPDSLRRRIASVTLTDAAPAEEPVTLATPMTMEALTDGTIVVNYSVIQCTPPSMKYSLNGGDKTTISSTTTINVSAGDKVQFYGNGTSITAYLGTIDEGFYQIKITGGTASVKVYGNIMSLVDETGYATATTVAEYAFQELFLNNSTLTDASRLLLPATTLAEDCYSHMFYQCTSLTTAPALPATTLVNSCYSGMFQNCTSLTAAPVLPATTLVTACYANMFNGCSSLSSVTCLATSGINSSFSTTNWLLNAGTQATGTKTFTAVSTANWPSGNNGIPSGWTRVDYTE